MSFKHITPLSHARPNTPRPQGMRNHSSYQSHVVYPPSGYAWTENPQMAEVRVRPARKAGKLNFGDELKQLLYAHGDDRDPLEETIRVLDDATTDFIIEACHGAAQIANYSGRQKVKVDDFRMLFRKDAHKLGRMLELEQLDKDMKAKRRLFDAADDKVDKGHGGLAEALGDVETDEDLAHAGNGEAVVGKKRKRKMGDDGQGSGKGKKKE